MNRTNYGLIPKTVNAQLSNCAATPCNESFVHGSNTNSCMYPPLWCCAESRMGAMVWVGISSSRMKFPCGYHRRSRGKFLTTYTSLKSSGSCGSARHMKPYRHSDIVYKCAPTFTSSKIGLSVARARIPGLVVPSTSSKSGSTRAQVSIEPPI